MAAQKTDYIVEKIDPAEVIALFMGLRTPVEADLNKLYKETKISGPTFADMLVKLEAAIIDASLKAVVAMRSKETHMDRMLKQAQINKYEAEVTEIGKKSLREDCISASVCGKNNAEKDLIVAKEKAEDIKNGDAQDGNSLYGKNKAVLGAQESLYKRQEKGFNDNARQKYYDSSVSTFGIMFQDLQSQDVPKNMNVAGIENIGTNVYANIGK